MFSPVIYLIPQKSIMEWQVVEKKQRKPSRKADEFQTIQTLRLTYPHLMDRASLVDIENRRNIVGIAEKLLSRECIELQTLGWKFVDVLTPKQKHSYEEPEYLIKSLDNGWGDVVVFKKIY